MNEDKVFSLLVENAFDFLLKASTEIDSQTKYSVMHFYAAVELFAKARLMKEDWSLVVSGTKEPDWDKFIAGDFQSVTLKDAHNRLKNIRGGSLSEAEMDAFKAVAKDRNKMVHFFHEPGSEEEREQFTRNIVKTELKAWLFLRTLLTTKWQTEFSSWGRRINELNTELLKMRGLLCVIFDILKPQIAENTKKGLRHDTCPSCGFDAFETQALSEDKNKIYVAKCLVCDFSEKSLNIQCPECETIVTLKNEGFGHCESCEKSFEPIDVAGALIDRDAERSVADGDCSFKGSCSECEGYHIVVRTENDEWICASCFDVFESLEVCLRCGKLTAGVSNSFSSVCNDCESGGRDKHEHA